MCRNQYVIATFCLVFIVPGYAQQTVKPFEEQFPTFKRLDHFQNYSVDQGMSNNMCRGNLLIDKQGFLWIGTVDGLNKFDGYRFQVFRHDPTDSNSISGNFSWTLYEDRRGDIWVGTVSAGLNRYSKSEGKFFRYYHDPLDSNGLSDNTITAIHEDRNNNLWIGTANGLNKLDLATGLRNNTRFMRYTHQANNPRSLGYNRVRSISEESSGSLLIGLSQDTTDGVDRYEPSIDGFVHVKADPRIPPELLYKKPIRYLEDSKHRVWITASDGLYQYDKRAAKLSLIWHNSDPAFPMEGKGPYEDFRGLIWYHKNGHIISIASDPLKVSEYKSGDPVHLDLIEDRSGNLWFSTKDNGLFKLSRNAMQFACLFPEGDTTKRFYAYFEDQTGGLWGTRGLTPKPSPSDYKMLKRIPSDYQISYGSSNSFKLKETAIRILEWDDQVLWIATNGSGLCELNRRTGRMSYYKRNPASNNVRENVVFSLGRETSQTLWLTTAAGFCRFDVVKKKYIKEYRHDPANASSISNDNTYWGLRDRNGFIWIGTQGGGLNRYDPRTERFNHWRHDPKDSNSLSSDYALGVYEDSDQNIWVSTDNALNKLDHQTGKFRRFRRRTNSSEFASFVTEGDHKTIWVTYLDGGLSRLDPRTGSFKTYTMSSGLPYKTVDADVYDGRRKSGELVFNSGGGLLVFYPDSIRDNTIPPTLVLTGLSVFERSLKLPFAMEEGYAPVTLPYDSNFFAFEFAALDFTDPGSNQYTYKLEGYEDNWNYVGNKREAHYTKVPPGEYVFRVNGTNSDGVWNEKGTFIKIIITPPWWKTVWAYGSYVVLLIAGLYSFRRNEKKRDRMKQQAELDRLGSEKRLQQEFSKQLIETQEAERKRVASELHDSLGQQLLIVNNELQLSLQSKQFVESDVQRTVSVVKDAIKEVREIASNLHPHHLEKLGLRAAVEAMIEQISRSTTVKFDVAVDDIDKALDMQAKINLYRVLQEAIANIVRHSEATHATITISHSDNAVQTIIEDNGRGFTQGASHGGRQGFGLKSMAERMSMIGGTITFDSSSGKGTTIKIIIPG